MHKAHVIAALRTSQNKSEMCVGRVLGNVTLIVIVIFLVWKSGRHFVLFEMDTVNAYAFINGFRTESEK